MSSGAVSADSGGGAGRVETGGLVRRNDRGEGEIDPGGLALSARRPSRRVVVPTASAERYAAIVAGSTSSVAHGLDAHPEANASHSRV